MIVTRLSGGLGNQMFQYAAGRRLSHALGAELGLDVSGFSRDGSREYALGVFDIKEHFVSSPWLSGQDLPRQGIFKRFRHILSRSIRNSSTPSLTYAKEKAFHFDPNILSLQDGVYLDGYWQTEKYFSDIASLVRSEFQFKPEQVGKNREFARAITSCMAVSVHVRRGDYVTNAAASQVHGACGLDYYLRSVEMLRRMFGDIHCFVFTDDPVWVRNNLDLGCPTTFVDHNGPDMAYEDLRLMSQCNHNVIANSSFSWWGAWLNPSERKIVIAPQQWFADPSFDTSDLLPPRWRVV